MSITCQFHFNHRNDANDKQLPDEHALKRNMYMKYILLENIASLCKCIFFPHLFLLHRVLDIGLHPQIHQQDCCLYFPVVLLHLPSFVRCFYSYPYCHICQGISSYSRSKQHPCLQILVWLHRIVFSQLYKIDIEPCPRVADIHHFHSRSYENSFDQLCLLFHH